MKTQTERQKYQPEIKAELIDSIEDDPHVLNMKRIKIPVTLVGIKESEETLIELGLVVSYRELGTEQFYSGLLQLEFFNGELDYEKIDRVAWFLANNYCRISKNGISNL